MLTRRTPLTLVLLLGASVLPASLHTTETAKPIFQAGFAERDITPDLGMEAPGGYGKSYHRSFHDPCKVRAAVFHDGRKRVAIIGLDLLFVTRAITVEARKAIQARCGIEPAHVLITASHSHSSGPIGMSEPGDFDNAPPLVKDLAETKSIVSNPGYTQLLLRQIVDAVADANETKVAAKAAVGYGHEDKVSFNRRLRMKGGITFSHPGAGNPDVLGYAGPIDPQVGVIGTWDEKGRLLGVVVNFACHATTNPGGISANWVGSMEQTLRAVTGNAALPVVFLQGACGDITQVDNLTKFQNPSAEEWWQIVGGRVGAEVYKTLLEIRRGAGSQIPLDARGKTWKAKRRLPAPEKVQRAHALVGRVGDVAQGAGGRERGELIHNSRQRRAPQPHHVHPHHAQRG